MPDQENIAALLQWKNSHEDLDRERFDNIKEGMADIKIILASMQIDLKGATQRIHDRIDGIVAESARIDNRIDKEALKTMSALVGAAIAIMVGFGKVIVGVLFK